MSMSDAANGNGTVPGDRAANMVRYQKKDFWSGENLRYSQPHFRMEKAALIVKRIAHGEERSLLDIGCGRQLWRACCRETSGTMVLI